MDRWLGSESVSDKLARIVFTGIKVTLLKSIFPFTALPVSQKRTKGSIISDSCSIVNSYFLFRMKVSYYTNLLWKGCRLLQGGSGKFY